MFDSLQVGMLFFLFFLFINFFYFFYLLIFFSFCGGGGGGGGGGKIAFLKNIFLSEGHKSVLQFKYSSDKIHYQARL